jgi:hypothetical protein
MICVFSIGPGDLEVAHPLANFGQGGLYKSSERNHITRYEPMQ